MFLDISRCRHVMGCVASNRANFQNSVLWGVEFVFVRARLVRIHLFLSVLG